jgi:hypothetical protein
MQVILTTQEAEIGIVAGSQPQANSQIPSQKYSSQKRAGGVAQVKELLASKCVLPHLKN